MERVFKLGEGEAGERLDKIVSSRLDLSRSQVQKLIEDGFVTINGHVGKSNHRVNAGEVISVEVPPPEPGTAQPENLPLAILYEDEDILVVNKPAGMVVHPAAGHSNGTLVNAVLGHAPGLVVGNAERPGIVHRLDRDTSGLIVIAKNDASLKALQAQFAGRTVHKTYLALVGGNVGVPQGKIEAPLARDPHDRKKFAVKASATARQAVTYFRVAQRLGEYTLLEVEPHTGRTHQIRVHLAFIKHPIVGDAVYGRKANKGLGLERQFLHAWRLALAHPRTGQAMEFTAALPSDLQEALLRFGGDPAPYVQRTGLVPGTSFLTLQDRERRAPRRRSPRR